MDIYITSTTQVIIALSCYVTIYALIIFLAWALKLKIQSKCCFAFLAIVGALLIIAAGFTGLAFQLISDSQSDCAKYHRKYSEVTTYAYCQIHHVDTHFNKTIVPNIQIQLNEYLEHMQSQTPKECPKRSISLILNDCSERDAKAPNISNFDMSKFQQLSKLPLCNMRDSVLTCKKKKRELLHLLKNALLVTKDAKRHRNDIRNN